MPADLLQFPDHYQWANRANHYFVLHASSADDFRTGEWLRFIHQEDLNELLKAFSTFGEADSVLHQDLVLLATLLFAREIGEKTLQTEAHLVRQLLQQLLSIAHLEALKRKKFIYVEQRLSIRPDWTAEVLVTTRGKTHMEKHGTLPPPFEDTTE